MILDESSVVQANVKYSFSRISQCKTFLLSYYNWHKISTKIHAPRRNIQNVIIFSYYHRKYVLIPIFKMWIFLKKPGDLLLQIITNPRAIVSRITERKKKKKKQKREESVCNKAKGTRRCVSVNGRIAEMIVRFHERLWRILGESSSRVGRKEGRHPFDALSL